MTEEKRKFIEDLINDLERQAKHRAKTESENTFWNGFDNGIAVGYIRMAFILRKLLNNEMQRLYDIELSECADYYDEILGGEE